MRLISRLARWLEPPRSADFANAAAGVESARSKLNDVQNRSASVHTVVQAHRDDRSTNHYGERILRALGGDFL